MVVGANDSINPRYFRVLESDGPVPTKLVRSADPLSQLQLPAFIVLIGENLVRVYIVDRVIYMCSEFLSSLISREGASPLLIFSCFVDHSNGIFIIPHLRS